MCPAPYPNISLAFKEALCKKQKQKNSCSDSSLVHTPMVEAHLPSWKNFLNSLQKDLVKDKAPSSQT